MGREARLPVDDGMTRAEARVHLDSEHLAIGPPFRLKLLLREVSDAAAVATGLAVTAPGRRIVLTMAGKEAAAWTKGILSPPSLATKLGLKPGLAVATLGRMPDEIAAELAVCRTRAMKAGAKIDEVLTIVTVPDGLPFDALARLAPALPAKGAAWLVYVKGGPFNGDELIHAARAAGLKDTKVAKISERRAALRFIAAAGR